MSSDPKFTKPSFFTHTISGQLLKALRGEAQAVGVFLIGIALPALLNVYLYYRQIPFNAQVNMALTIWYLLAGICLWRCAFNVPRRALGYIARVYAGLVVLWQLVCAYVIMVQ